MDRACLQQRTLSTRQQEVLDLVCKGLRNSEVARVLRLSERTIKGYVSQLLLIFDATNRTELVAVVLEQGFVALKRGSHDLILIECTNGPSH